MLSASLLSVSRISFPREGAAPGAELRVRSLPTGADFSIYFSVFDRFIYFFGLCLVIFGYLCFFSGVGDN